MGNQGGRGLINEFRQGIGLICMWLNLNMFWM